MRAASSLTYRSDLSLEIPRAEILGRLGRGNAQIVVLVAPAGFGKTTFAQQLARAAGPFVVCDCADLTSDVEFAGRVVAALARLPSEQRIGILTHCQIALGTASAPLDERLATVVDAWRVAPGQGAVIFDNAEGLTEHRTALGFFTKLLRGLPQGRPLVICSRAPLPLRISRFVAPDRVVTLLADDLAFNAAELSAAFASTGTSAALIARVAAVARGWPIVAMLLARFAREGHLESTLDKADDIAFDDLHDYLAEEVLETLEASIITLLAMCAFVPSIVSHEIANATADPESLEAFERFARSSPLVSQVDDRYELHPLVRATLVLRYADKRDAILRSVAEFAQRNGDVKRAAELHLLRGDQEAAARDLDSVDWIERPNPPLELARNFAELDREVIRRYPRLWAVTVLHGRFSFDPHVAVGEAHALLRGMDGATPVAVRSYVVRPLAGFLSRLGMHDLAYNMIRDFEAETHVPATPQSFDQAAVVYIRAMISGRMGRLAEFREQFARAWPYASRSGAMTALLLTERGAEAERALGQREAERATLEEALTTARSTGISTNIGFALAESVFGAWLAGERKPYEALLDELESAVERDGIRGFRYFVDCARGRLDRTPSGTELAKWVVAAELLACASADGGERKRRARAAANAATQYGAPFMEMLAFLALGEAEPEQRRDAFENAIRAAQRVESKTLANAVAAYVSGESSCGMLDGFAARMQSSASAERRVLEVDVLTATARLGRESIELSDRKLELVLALARHRAPTPREELQELLWPSVDEESSKNAFNVCLHHVRQQTRNGVVRTQNGYALVPEACVDLWDLESFMAGVRIKPSLSSLERTSLGRWLRRLCLPRPARALRWPWFEPTERRIAELRCEAAEYLAREALRSGAPLEALELMQAVLAYDPCDEFAHEIAIRAHLAAGNRRAAIREYRRYVDVLERELQAQPSFTFEEIAGS